VPVAGAHSSPRISANGRLLVADSLVADRLLDDPALTGRHVVSMAFSPTLSIADLDVGTVVVQVPGPEWNVNLINTGPGSFVPASVTIDNTTDFTISGGTCLDLAPIRAGQYCDVKVIMTPSVAGPVNATLTVAEEGFGAITLTSPVMGAGGEPALDAAPSGVEFGDAVVGAPAETAGVFDITNIYPAPTMINSVTVTGANPADFAVTANTCGVEITLGAGCQVEVAFTPTAAGRRSALVNVNTTLGQYTSVIVSGDGHYEPTLIVPPSVKPGDLLGLGVSGFPADSPVVIGWSDGSGQTATVVTNAKGEAIVQLRVGQGDRAGVRNLIAQVPGGAGAAATIEIERVRDRRTGG
jgi:hypothetical protein